MDANPAHAVLKFAEDPIAAGQQLNGFVYVGLFLLVKCKAEEPAVGRALNGQQRKVKKGSCLHRRQVCQAVHQFEMPHEGKGIGQYAVFHGVHGAEQPGGVAFPEFFHDLAQGKPVAQTRHQHHQIGIPTQIGFDQMADRTCFALRHTAVGMVVKQPHQPGRIYGSNRMLPDGGRTVL